MKGNQSNFNMIFTSNKNPALWREDFDEDATLLCALDRIFAGLQRDRFQLLSPEAFATQLKYRGVVKDTTVAPTEISRE